MVVMDVYSKKCVEKLGFRCGGIKKKKERVG